jgi:hypothetical protein
MIKKNILERQNATVLIKLCESVLQEIMESSVYLFMYGTPLEMLSVEVIISEFASYGTKIKRYQKQLDSIKQAQYENNKLQNRRKSIVIIQKYSRGFLVRINRNKGS